MKPDSDYGSGAESDEEPASDVGSASAPEATHETQDEPAPYWRVTHWLPIGRLAGVPIIIDLWFLCAGLLICVLRLTSMISWPPVDMLAVLLGSVFVHEFGHALAAKIQGVHVGGIFLHIVPFAWIDTGPYRDRVAARRTLWIALGGPLASALLAGIFWLAGGRFDVLRDGMESLRDLGNYDASLFLWVNAAMVVLNLLPALPADGGRALEALLRPRVSVTVLHYVLAATGLVVGLALLTVGAQIGGPFNTVIMLLGVIFLYAAVRVWRSA